LGPARLNQMTRVHDQDAINHLLKLARVVTYQQQCQVQLRLQGLQQCADLGLRYRVE
jgi:hypothetical protein